LHQLYGHYLLTKGEVVVLCRSGNLTHCRGLNPYLLSSKNQSKVNYRQKSNDTTFPKINKVSIGFYFRIETYTTYIMQHSTFGTPLVSKRPEIRRYWALFSGILGTLALLVATVLGSITIGHPAVHAASSGDWPMYLHDLGRSSYNSAETVINPSTASTLKPRWIHQAGGNISTQPVVSNGLIYWGSWDGYEHATNPTNPTGDLWTTNLGQTPVFPNCYPQQIGVASSAAVATVLIKGKPTRVVFVGGGNGNFYALNALTGKIIWSRLLGSTAQGYFLWSSPVVFRGSVFMGVASLGDCPLVPGEVVKLNASNGNLQNVWYAGPANCAGGGVWSSITIDEAVNKLYLSTGTQGGCSSVQAPSLVELTTENLSLVGAWQVPVSQQLGDSDFGASPTLFTATIGGTFHKLVGLANKNGLYYAFDRDKISVGPVWTSQPLVNSEILVGSSAWDGTNLYIAASATTIGGVSCQGSLRAINPANGNFIWQTCLTNGPVYGSVTLVPGLAVVGAGSVVYVIATTTTTNITPGTILFSYQDILTYHWFWAGPSISHGVLYAPNEDGNFFALTPNGQ
jgi:outer membrane protein assembly factor BamB